MPCDYVMQILPLHGNVPTGQNFGHASIHLRSPLMVQSLISTCCFKSVKMSLELFLISSVLLNTSVKYLMYVSALLLVRILKQLQIFFPRFDRVTYRLGRKYQSSLWDPSSYQCSLLAKKMDTRPKWKYKVFFNGFQLHHQRLEIVQSLLSVNILVVWPVPPHDLMAFREHFCLP